MIYLSPNFAFWELTVTSHRALQDRPSEENVANARIFLHATVEPVRSACGVPLRTESFYRSEALNSFVKGADNSLHKRACAIDFVPRGLHRRIVWDRILRLSELGLRFTEAIIYEGTGHIHLAYAWWDGPPRRNLLVKPEGGASYVQWADYDGWLKRGLQ